jgi:hypothetical protein
MIPIVELPAPRLRRPPVAVVPGADTLGEGSVALHLGLGGKPCHELVGLAVGMFDQEPLEEDILDWPVRAVGFVAHTVGLGPRGTEQDSCSGRCPSGISVSTHRAQLRAPYPPSRSVITACRNASVARQRVATWAP